MSQDNFDPNTFPAQQFTGVPPSPLPGLAGFSAAAKAFIREYVPADDDEGAIGTFETVREYKPAKSQKMREQATAAGKEPGPDCEVYEDVVFIRINIRGNDKLEVHRPAREEDKRRFPFAWQEFQKGSAAAERGTALTKLPGMEPNMTRRYHSFNVFTIEDLALITDTHGPNLGTGWREMRQRAIEYVNSRKTSVQHNAEMDELRATMARQGEQLAQALALIERQSEENAKLSALVSKPKGKGSESKE